MHIDTTVTSSICIIAGLVFVAFGIGYFLFKLMLLLIGFYLINFGLSLRGWPSLHIMAHSWFSRRWF